MKWHRHISVTPNTRIVQMCKRKRKTKTKNIRLNKSNSCGIFVWRWSLNDLEKEEEINARRSNESDPSLWAYRCATKSLSKVTTTTVKPTDKNVHIHTDTNISSNTHELYRIPHLLVTITRMIWVWSQRYTWISVWMS